MKPHRSILDPAFKYLNSAQTDVRKTFARIRREQKEATERESADKRELEQKLLPLKRIGK